MSASISVVIPVVDGEATLPASLSALVEGLTAGLIKELIIVDGGSADHSEEIADAAGAQWIVRRGTRAARLRAGAAAARGSWLLFLEQDTILSPGWSTAVGEHLDHHAGQAGYFALSFDVTGLRPGCVAGLGNLRARALGLPLLDQGLLVSKAHYARAGGYPDIGAMEDLALARRLGRRQVVRLSASARTSAARYVSEGWFRHSLSRLGSQLLFLTGAAPERLGQRRRR